LDKLFASTSYYNAPHFRSGGWGFNPLDPTDPVLLDIRSRVSSLARRSAPPHLRISWADSDKEPRLVDGVLVRDGSFLSPAHASLPIAAHTAHFRAVWPAGDARGCAMMVMLPPNGDEDYESRFRGLARCNLTPANFLFFQRVPFRLKVIST
jgi:hypothetical protein